VIRSHAKAEHSSHLPFTIFFEICFRLGRNYALAATETVRYIRSISSHPYSISGGRQESQEELFEPVVPGARARLATHPGPARTTNRGGMFDRRHSEKDRAGGHTQAELRAALGKVCRHPGLVPRDQRSRNGLRVHHCRIIVPDVAPHGHLPGTIHVSLLLPGFQPVSVATTTRANLRHGPIPQRCAG
jgi:hypothetical protein